MTTFQLHFDDGCESFGETVFSHEHRHSKEEFLKDCKWLLKNSKVEIENGDAYLYLVKQLPSIGYEIVKFDHVVSVWNVLK